MKFTFSISCIKWIFILLITISFTTGAKSFQLPSILKFSMGDKIEGASQSYNDSNQENKAAFAFSGKINYWIKDEYVKMLFSEPKPVIENKIQDAFTSIPFQQQQLTGYLGKRMKQNIVERLLKIDEKGIMDGYLQRPGNHPWIGEHAGKYIETACNAWKNTQDERLKRQIDRMVFELIHAQLEDGYLGTYIPPEYWTSWDVWSHKYNLYGLLAYYKATGYQPALDACKKMGNLICTTFGNKPGQRDIITAGEHMGMAATSILDPMVELYRYTGDLKYLNFCYYILDAWEQTNGPKIISSLLATAKVTIVGNGKAYEMLSNLVGLTNLYRVTGDNTLLRPVLIAWHDIVNNRLYITGTASSMEYFQDDEILPAAAKDNMGEGCVTTTWIQLNKSLLDITGDLKYLDEIEKSVYNHLLAAENPLTGCVSYYTPLMDKKPFNCDITCCTSSVPRGIAMIPYFTTGLINNIPAVLLYENANYKETNDLSLQVETDFPKNNHVAIIVNTSATSPFSIALRVPSWTTSFSATIGDTVYTKYSNGLMIVNRIWRLGDTIKLLFDTPIQELKGGKSYPNQFAFKRGPQVLAFDPSLNGEHLITDNQILQKDWIELHAYFVNSIEPEGKSEKMDFYLVPFADAGLTGGAVYVWLPLKQALP